MTDLHELAQAHLKRAERDPDPVAKVRDVNTAALLLIAFELHRIASTLADIKVMALAEGEQ